MVGPILLGRLMTLTACEGAMVTKERLYPDFDIDQYWGADDDTNERSDVVRIVVEVASLGKDTHGTHSEAVVQLQNYIDAVGEQWDQRLVGLAILGNEAYLLHRTQEDLQIRKVYGDEDDNDDDNDNDYDGGQNKHWMSLFDPRVVQVLDEMHTLSMLSED